MKRYRAVFFDVDGTLYKSRDYEEHLLVTLVRVLSEMLGVGKGEAYRLLHEKKREVETVSRSVELLGLDRRVFYERLAEAVEVEKYITRQPGTAWTLREIRSRGIFVGLHTNSGRKLALRVLQQLGVESDCYDILVTSDDAEPKPDPLGYKLLLSKAGVSHAEALYVGDRCRVELKPAAELGMDTALVGAGPCVYAVFHVSRVDEVLDLI